MTFEASNIAEEKKMSVKQGEVASIKTTQEPVFVLGIEGDKATVRRPTMGNDGVKHLVEDFLLVELETESDRIERNFKEKQALQHRVFGEGQDTVQTIGPAN